MKRVAHREGFQQENDGRFGRILFPSRTKTNVEIEKGERMRKETKQIGKGSEGER